MWNLLHELTYAHHPLFWVLRYNHMWDKVFKSGLSKFCGRPYLCLSGQYPLKFFEGCLPQNLLSPLLNTLSHAIILLFNIFSLLFALQFFMIKATRLVLAILTNPQPPADISTTAVTFLIISRKFSICTLAAILLRFHITINQEIVYSVHKLLLSTNYCNNKDVW